MSTTMIRWAQHEYGGPEVVALENVEVPTPGDGQVLLRVRAVAVNSGDVRLMRGDPRLVRLAFGLRRPKYAVRGMDVAGTVVALGSGVADFAVGDEVVGELPGGGGLAEYAIAPTARLVARPHALTPELAATLPIAAGTAVQALDLARVESGHRVLVNGASGGVGTFAVQLAAHRGADVWALTGARTEQLIANLGASRTFDYRTTSAGDLPEASFDAILDLAGTTPLRALRRLLAPRGTLVLVAAPGSGPLGPLPRMLGAAVLSVGSRRRIRPLAAVAKPEVLRELVGLAADGRIAPVIERSWPLSEARDVLAHVDAGRTVGKVVVTLQEGHLHMLVQACAGSVACAHGDTGEAGTGALR